MFADFVQLMPWFVLLFVFGGMLILCWKLSVGNHDLSTLLAQALSQLAGGRTIAPALAPLTPLVPAAPLPTVLPAPALVPLPSPLVPIPLANVAPLWFQWAIGEIGFHETGNNQGIERYVALAKTGAEGEPWCAIFANAAFETSGIHGTRSALSQSFRTDINFVQLTTPSRGCVVVFWRGSRSSGLGHVGFYWGEDANSIWTLGGNENDMVQVEALAKSSASFGFVGYYWPKSIDLPTTGPVMMPTGSPVHIQVVPINKPIAIATNGVHTNIVATFFQGQQTAYGGPIDDTKYGVALPFRFTGARPRVRVTGKKNGVSIDCDIIDIGPWNINDPSYIEGTARPQAESGFDLGQVSKGVPRKTNKAGIDLSLAAAIATGIDGKGLVDWSFIDANPTVT